MCGNTWGQWPWDGGGSIDIEDPIDFWEWRESGRNHESLPRHKKSLRGSSLWNQLVFNGRRISDGFKTALSGQVVLISDLGSAFCNFKVKRFNGVSEQTGCFAFYPRCWIVLWFLLGQIITLCCILHYVGLSRVEPTAGPTRHDILGSSKVFCSTVTCSSFKLLFERGGCGCLDVTIWYFINTQDQML